MLLRLFSRTPRRAAAVRPFRARLSVERLEGRDAPSSLDTTSLASPLPDPTDTTGTAAVALAPAPQTMTAATPSQTTPVVTTMTVTSTPLPSAGDMGPAPALIDDTLDPAYVGTNDNGNGTYTVSGTVADPNQVALAVTVTLDELSPVAATVAPTAKAGTYSWSVTFALAADTSATASTHYGAATAKDGARTSNAMPFSFSQAPQVASSISSPSAAGH